MYGKNKQLYCKTSVIVLQVQVVILGEIGRGECLSIQDLGTEYRQPKTKVPART